MSASIVAIESVNLCFLCTQSGIDLSFEWVPIVKIWGSSKNYQNQIAGKFLKFFALVVVLQFRLTYLNKQTKMRNETLEQAYTVKAEICVGLILCVFRVDTPLY